MTLIENTHMHRYSHTDGIHIHIVIEVQICMYQRRKDGLLGPNDQLTQPSEWYINFSSHRHYRLEEREALGWFCSFVFGNGSQSLQDRADRLYNSTDLVFREVSSCSFPPSQGLDYPLDREAA